MNETTDAQDTALIVLPAISAFLSIVGSGCIMFAVLTKKRCDRTTYHRLLLVMSLLDIIFSSQAFFRSAVLPEVHPYDLFEAHATGGHHHHHGGHHGEIPHEEGHHGEIPHEEGHHGEGEHHGGEEEPHHGQTEGHHGEAGSHHGEAEAPHGESSEHGDGGNDDGNVTEEGEHHHHHHHHPGGDDDEEAEAEDGESEEAHHGISHSEEEKKNDPDHPDPHHHNETFQNNSTGRDNIFLKTHEDEEPEEDPDDEKNRHNDDRLLVHHENRSMETTESGGHDDNEEDADVPATGNNSTDGQGIDDEHEIDHGGSDEHGSTEHGTEHGNTEHGTEHGSTEHGTEHGNTEHGTEHGNTEHGTEHGNTTTAAAEEEAKGKILACNVVGFLTHFSVGTAGYNAMLSLYYFLTINMKMKAEYVSKYVEPWMHAVILCYVLGTAIACWVLELYNIDRCGLMCYIAPYPYDCVDNPNVPCLRGSHAERYIWYFSFGELLLFFLIVLICQTAIFLYVRRRVRSLKRYSVSSFSLDSGSRDGRSSEFDSQRQEGGNRSSNLSLSNVATWVQKKRKERREDQLRQQSRRGSTSSSGSASQHGRGGRGGRRGGRRNRRVNIMSEQDRKVRDVAIQAGLYVTVFCATWFFVVLTRVAHIFENLGIHNYWVPLAFLIEMLFPLQGFLNFLVYLRPIYNRYRLAYKSATFLQVLIASLRSTDMTEWKRQGRRASASAGARAGSATGVTTTTASSSSGIRGGGYGSRTIKKSSTTTTSTTNAGMSSKSHDRQGVSKEYNSDDDPMMMASPASEDLPVGAIHINPHKVDYVMKLKLQDDDDSGDDRSDDDHHSDDDHRSDDDNEDECPRAYRGDDNERLEEDGHHGQNED